MTTPYELATRDLGTTEIRGAVHNDTIVQYFADVEHGWVKDDETAWCAAGMGSWHIQAGYSLSELPVKKDRLSAQSWRNVGAAVELKDLKPGDILVFRRGKPGSWQGHVGFATGRIMGSKIEVRGGNQSNQVKDSWYPMHSANYELIAIRRMKPLVERTPHQVMRDEFMRGRGKAGSEIGLITAIGAVALLIWRGLFG
ncbi:MAG: hypothetical protein AAGK37_19400 [Pseudomonadota bacterium]